MLLQGRRPARTSLTGHSGDLEHITHDAATAAAAEAEAAGPLRGAKASTATATPAAADSGGHGIGGGGDGSDDDADGVDAGDGFALLSGPLLAGGGGAETMLDVLPEEARRCLHALKVRPADRTQHQHAAWEQSTVQVPGQWCTRLIGSGRPHCHVTCAHITICAVRDVAAMPPVGRRLVLLQRALPATGASVPLRPAVRRAMSQAEGAGCRQGFVEGGQGGGCGGWSVVLRPCFEVEGVAAGKRGAWLMQICVTPAYA